MHLHVEQERKKWPRYHRRRDTTTSWNISTPRYPVNYNHIYDDHCTRRNLAPFGPSERTKRRSADLIPTDSFMAPNGWIRDHFLKKWCTVCEPVGKWWGSATHVDSLRGEGTAGRGTLGLPLGAAGPLKLGGRLNGHTWAMGDGVGLRPRTLGHNRDILSPGIMWPTSTGRTAMVKRNVAGWSSMCKQSKNQLKQWLVDHRHSFSWG